jgi:hypothetical protein
MASSLADANDTVIRLSTAWSRLILYKAKNDFVWGLGFAGAIKYYTWTLTLCRIGHKPKLKLRTKNRQVSAELSCTRCKRVLDFQVSLLLP